MVTVAIVMVLHGRKGGSLRLQAFHLVSPRLPQRVSALNRSRGRQPACRADRCERGSACEFPRRCRQAAWRALHWYSRTSKNQRHLGSIGNEVLGTSTCPSCRSLHRLPSSAKPAVLPITRAGAAAEARNGDGNNGQQRGGAAEGGEADIVGQRDACVARRWETGRLSPRRTRRWQTRRVLALVYGGCRAHHAAHRAACAGGRGRVAKVIGSGPSRLGIWRRKLVPTLGWRPYAIALPIRG
jgi:hypothetical protein